MISSNQKKGVSYTSVNSVYVLILILFLFSLHSTTAIEQISIESLNSSYNVSYLFGKEDIYTLITSHQLTNSLNTPITWVDTYQKNNTLYQVTYNTNPIYSESDFVSRGNFWSTITTIFTNHTGNYSNITIVETIPSTEFIEITPNISYEILSDTQIKILIPLLNKEFTYSVFGQHVKKTNVSINETTLTNNTLILNEQTLSPMLEINEKVQFDNGIINATQTAILKENITTEKPVKWKVSTNKTRIELPKNSTNIVVERQQNTSENITITFETPAPIKKEQNISFAKKEVQVTSEFHYKNITTSTTLQSEISFAQQDAIRIYWKENNTYLNFTVKDTNNNSLIDTVEWIIPHLSTQTFEIIVITQADHLDANRNFLQDIYPLVFQKDEIWSPLIEDGDYVRVQFEENLTNEKDITVFPLIYDGNPIIEVYEVNNDTPLHFFDPLTDDSYNKIYLTNLTSPQDTFDLRVVGGSLFLDHIIDPTIIFTPLNAPAGDIDHCTLTNSTFVLAWCTDTNTYCQLSAFNTNGTLINSINMSTAAPIYSRTSVACMNETTLLAGRIISEGGNSEDGEIARYSFINGIFTLEQGWVALDIDLADPGETFFDLELEAINETHVYYLELDNQDEDTDGSIINVNDLSATPEVNIDTNTGTTFMSWHDHIEIATLSNERLVACYYDRIAGDLTTVLMEIPSNTALIISDFDNNIGNFGAISCTGLRNNKVATAYYDSDDLNIYIGVIDYTLDIETTILSATSIDSNVGTSDVNQSNISVSVGTIRSDETYYFAVAYTDKTDQTVKAAVYNDNGIQITAPFNVTQLHNQNYNYSQIEIIGSDVNLNRYICNGSFAVAYTENDNQTKIKTFYSNGTQWDGVCQSTPKAVDMTYPIFYNQSDNSATLTNNGIAEFNISVNQTNGSIVLSFSGIDYTATNNSNHYTVSVPVNVPSEQYSYYWYAFGNGTDNLYNQTETSQYVVNALAPNIHYAGFESGFQGWQSNSPLFLAIIDTTNSHFDDSLNSGGTNSIRIIDDNLDSRIYQSFNFSGYDYITLEFASLPFSFEPGEFVDVKCDNTIIFSNEYVLSQGLWINESIRIWPSNCTFDESTTIEFTANPGLSGAADYWNIDGINITGEFNKAPDQPNVQINSTAGIDTSNQNLNCFGTISDIDSQSLNVTVYWYKNGILDLTITNNSNHPSGTVIYSRLLSQNTTVGEDWSCSISASDGFLSGLNGTSSNLTILPNAPPFPPTPNINSSDGSDLFDKDLFCEDILVDSESEPINVTVRWYNNGIINVTQQFNNSYPSGTSFTSSLLAANTSRFETWYCELQLTDGNTESLNGSSNNLTILNQEPQQIAPLLRSTFDTNYTDEDLNCLPQGITDYENDTVYYVYNWYKNSKVLEILNFGFDYHSNSTQAKDFSVSNITATSNNELTWSNNTGFFGDGAYTFNGDFDQLNFTIPTDLNHNFTLLTRFRPDASFGNVDGIIGTLDGSTGWYLGSGSSRQHILFDNGFEVFETLTDHLERNQWSHVGVTYDGSIYRIYHDGDLVFTSNPGRNSPEFNSQMVIGGYPSANINNHFPGIISDVKLINISLSEREIESYFEGIEGTLISNATLKDETWACSITPTDTFDFGTRQMSNNLTIRSGFNLSIEEMTFNTSNFIEGENTTITLNITNTGQRDASDVVVRINTSFWNGSNQFNESLFSTSTSLLGQSSKTIDINWTIKPGNWTFSAFIDFDNIIDEFDESNNEQVNVTLVSSHAVVYGKHNNTLAVGSGEIQFKDWEVNPPEITIYFADFDASFIPDNLLPLNGTNDFTQADTVLNIGGYFDSISTQYDADSNDIADNTITLIVGNSLVENIPFINSTNSSSFITGLLWDSADGGSEYDGTQDLVFVTQLNSSQQGLYGVYDYEVSLPSNLGSLTGSLNLIARIEEVR